MTPDDLNFVNVQAQNIVANIARDLGRHVIAPRTDHTSWVALSVIDWDTGWTVEIEWGDHLPGGCCATLHNQRTAHTTQLDALDLDGVLFAIRNPALAVEAEHLCRGDIDLRDAR